MRRSTPIDWPTQRCIISPRAVGRSRQRHDHCAWYHSSFPAFCWILHATLRFITFHILMPRSALTFLHLKANYYLHPRCGIVDARLAFEHSAVSLVQSDKQTNKHPPFRQTHAHLNVKTKLMQISLKLYWVKCSLSLQFLSTLSIIIIIHIILAWDRLTVTWVL